MNYLGNILLFWIVLALITLVGVLIAHWLFRILYVWRRYPGVSIEEDAFILLFTIPSVAGGGYVVVCLPIGISLLLSIGIFVWSGEWPHDERFFSMNNVFFSEWPTTLESWGGFLVLATAWLVPVFGASWLRRRKKNGLIGSHKES